jgi:hypothetical protein
VSFGTLFGKPAEARVELVVGAWGVNKLSKLSRWEKGMVRYEYENDAGLVSMIELRSCGRQGRHPTSASGYCGTPRDRGFRSEYERVRACSQ